MPFEPWSVWFKCYQLRCCLWLDSNPVRLEDNLLNRCAIAALIISTSHNPHSPAGRLLSCRIFCADRALSVLVVLNKADNTKDIFKELSIVCGLSNIIVEVPYKTGGPGQWHCCQHYDQAKNTKETLPETRAAQLLRLPPTREGKTALGGHTGISKGNRSPRAPSTTIQQSSYQPELAP
ncbi:hypothetical protein EVAR_23215_1 [Eumeta japonica]|uniref:Uncharacterized protein n=1 Tax=Eumeta variegata TaxID=151549 RepID=A0A4C1VE83_EUMVA|nr:hypothetical protein EVAR_23215_1 [Eumeta japonica]